MKNNGLDGSLLLFGARLFRCHAFPVLEVSQFKNRFFWRQDAGGNRERHMAGFSIATYGLMPVDYS